MKKINKKIPNELTPVEVNLTHGSTPLIEITDFNNGKKYLYKMFDVYLQAML